MKSILYVGTALMISASIYGFVDYKKANRNKEFKNMYAGEKVSQPVAIPEKEDSIPVIEPMVETKTVMPEKRLKENPGSKKVTNPGGKGNPVKRIKVKKQKKLDTELFSRAPLREFPAINDTPKVKKEQ
ncbi:MAG: hypothetical protein ACXWWD_04710 [Chitinophagaceae bacterium]